MSLLKKISPEWIPTENEGLKVGETVDITDYRQLVLNGIAVLVDEQGNEMPLPGQKFACPICFKETENLAGFVNHVDGHKKGVRTTSPTVAEVENTRGAAEPNVVAPVEEIVPAVSVEAEAEEIVDDFVSTGSLPTMDKAEELRRQRVANMAKARLARVQKLEGSK